MNMSQSTFASDFHSARELFIDAAEKSGAAVDSFRHPHDGPDGRPLKTDVAWVGPDNAERVLMTVSGTHGVEGFCGSGAQVDWLRRGEATRLPDGTAACLVHAINPYGFAWVRRVTHENIDLNRNWIDFDAGRALSGESMETLSDELLAYIIAVASGQPARNEVNGEREIAIWKDGVTL